MNWLNFSGMSFFLSLAIAIGVLTSHKRRKKEQGLDPCMLVLVAALVLVAVLLAVLLAALVAFVVCFGRCLVLGATVGTFGCCSFFCGSFGSWSGALCHSALHLFLSNLFISFWFKITLRETFLM